MRAVRRAARRLGFALLTVLLVLTLMFVVTGFFPDPPNSLFDTSEPPEGSPRDADTPLTDRYVTWLVKFLTLDWSYTDRAVSKRVFDALGVTATYLVPAVLLSYVGGVVIGVRAALSRGGPSDRLSRAVSYVGFGVPTFFAAAVGWFLFGWETGWTLRYDPARPHFSTYNLTRIAIPVGVMTVTTTAIQIRHARSEVLAQLREGYAKLARSQGAGDRRLGRYTLRNAAGPILSLFVSELLGTVLLSALALELVWRIPGFGRLLLLAARDRQPPLVLGVTFVTVAVGLAATLLRDGALALLTPERRD
jgi:peptide/nickel transport system permease protein